MSPRTVLPLHPIPSSEVTQAERTAVLHFSARLRSRSQPPPNRPRWTTQSRLCFRPKNPRRRHPRKTLFAAATTSTHGKTLFASATSSAARGKPLFAAAAATSTRGKTSSPPTPPLAGKPSSPPPLPPLAVDEKPSAPPPTDAATEPAPATKPRKITRKVRTIKRRVPKGTIAAWKAAAEAALAAAGALQPGKGHALDYSSQNAAAVDEVVQKEQSFGGHTIEKLATAVCETLLGKGTAVCETLLGKGTVRGGTLASGLATDIGGEHEVKKLGSRGEDRAEVVMSERQRRRMTEVFVDGLSRDTKEEDVRAALSVAGDITEVRMIMDATTKKNKGYCFVRYRESAQARKAIANFSNVKICGKQCRVAALGGNDKIFLGNLDKKWKKDDIMKLLQKIGVENIDVATLPADSNNPGYNRGFAFVELETYKDAQIAYKKLSRKYVFGKGLNIRVAWAEPLNGPDENRSTRLSAFSQFLSTISSISLGERILGPSSLHIFPSSSRAVPPTGDKKSSTDHGLVQVLREMVPWRHEHTGSDSDSVLSEEPWGGIQMRQACSRKSGMSHDSWHLQRWASTD
ncbi:unnamed protein product [Miscanthus lutarioriparius]|uniref:RRM domain-containing protein n=1 Tax=Miscanthus lutarioriparius TaxID=422564 RepID=A0A811NBI2_9POAL|nr:unnamed protein product [Miscanthus lutarioriparius]